MTETSKEKHQLKPGEVALAPWIVYCLVLVITVSTAYSTFYAKQNYELRLVLAFILFVLGGVFWILLMHVVAPYRLIMVMKRNLLLLVYCIVFIGLFFVHPRPDHAPYLFFAIWFYFAIPTLFLFRPSFFFIWLEMIVWSCAILAAIVVISLSPLDSFLGLPFAMKHGGGGVLSSAGIIEHPLTMGPMLAIGIFTVLYQIDRSGFSIRRLMFLLVMGIGLVIVQSRGAYLSTMAGMTIFLTWRRINWTSLKVYFLAALAMSTPFFIGGILATVPILSDWFRVEAGLSNREIVWALGVSEFLKQPVLGWGLGTAAEITAQYSDELEAAGYGAAGASFHNTYITKLVEGGLIYAAVYCYLYLATIRIALRSSVEDDRKKYFVCVATAIVVFSFFIDISIGGIRSLSIWCAVHLGIANLSGVVRGNYGLVRVGREGRH